MDKESVLIATKLHTAMAMQRVHLEIFGDELAQQEGYKSHTGIDAVHWYLINHYRWLPSVVRALNIDDLTFLMQEKMHGWTVPDRLR